MICSAGNIGRMRWDQMLNTFSRVCTWERSGEIQQTDKTIGVATGMLCVSPRQCLLELSWVFPSSLVASCFISDLLGFSPLLLFYLFCPNISSWQPQSQAHRTKRPSFLDWENSRRNSWRLDANNLFQQRERRYRTRKLSCEPQC